MPDTPTEILSIARALVREGGPAALTFDAIARRLGRSKQAVLYWYPSRSALLAALYLPWLEAESEVAERAVADSRAGDAVAAFVRAVAGFHMGDLDRFRLVYLAPQLQKAGTELPADLLARLHATTGRLYAALAARLEIENARAEAMAIHSSVLGLVTMVALADAIGDPLAHETDLLVDRLVDRLT